MDSTILFNEQAKTPAQALGDDLKSGVTGNFVRDFLLQLQVSYPLHYGSLKHLDEAGLRDEQYNCTLGRECDGVLYDRVLSPSQTCLP